MEKDLMVICPTRERPDLCAQMIESFDRTASAYVNLVFILDADDIYYREYEALFAKSKHGFITNYQDTVTELYNLCVNQYYSGYRFYSQTNDDFIYHTKNWDQILINKLIEHAGGIAFGDDGFPAPRAAPRTLPTTSVISGQIIRALGWIHMPALGHLCNDMVWREIGLHLKKLFYVPEVKIEHMSPLAGKSPEDATFERTNKGGNYTRDNKAFRVWRDHGAMKEDLAKIRAAYDKEERN